MTDFDNEVEFAYQFLISNGNMSIIAVKQFSIFNRKKPADYKEININTTLSAPLDNYDSICDKYINPVKYSLFNLINISKEDSEVTKFSITMMEKMLEFIKRVNRVKVERVMTIIRCGIPPSCNFKTMEALVDLEDKINIYYPPDRKFFSSSEYIIFSENVYKFIIDDLKMINYLIDRTNFDENFTKETRKLLLQVIGLDYSQIPKLIGCYMGKIEMSETPINSVMSVAETFDIINKRIIELNLKTIELSTITVSTIIKNNELHVEYFGVLNKPIGGHFILDFYKLNEILTPKSYTYYIFYFITYHYCLMNKDNILKIKLKNKPKIVNSSIMFKFLELSYLNKIKCAIRDIPNEIGYARIFSLLEVFFTRILKN
jgi:hypothetical protein